MPAVPAAGRNASRPADEAGGPRATDVAHHVRAFRRCVTGVNVSAVVRTFEQFGARVPAWQPWPIVGDNLPNTLETQQLLYDRQWRVNCSSARFLIWSMYNNGIGSDLHTTSMAMALAINSDRVLLLTSVVRSWYYVDAKTCGDTRTFECYFARVSKCTLGDLSAERLASAGRFKGRTPAEFYAMTEDIVIHEPLSTHPVWAHELPRLPFKPAGYASSIHWWRAQCVRYFLREPTPLTANFVRMMAIATFPNPTAGVPRNLINLHVRHGDKFREMTLAPLGAHIAAAERLRAKHPELTGLFLSTEDPAVIDEAVTVYARNWTIYYTPNRRINTGPLKSAATLGRSCEALISFANLYFAVECDYFVGTLGSNWNRMIRELARTGNKLSRGYVALNNGEW